MPHIDSWQRVPEARLYCPPGLLTSTGSAGEGHSALSSLLHAILSACPVSTGLPPENEPWCGHLPSRPASGGWLDQIFEAPGLYNERTPSSISRARGLIANT